MGKRPPTYTFRRPKKRASPPPSSQNMYTETYTHIDDSEGVNDQISRYTRYSFFVSLFILVLLVLSICYIYMKGVPVRIRA